MSDISILVDKVKSKYLLVMIAAKRARQLSLLEQKAVIINEDPDKLKSRADLENIGMITEDEKKALKNHKPILVALDELNDDMIEFSFKEE